MTTPAALPSIVETLHIDAPPERVWPVLVGDANVPQWLGCLDYRGEIGHVFYMQPDPDKRAAADLDGATHCEILVIEEPRRFAFSWYLPGTPATRVDITLAASGTGTDVTLEHSGWDQFDPAVVGEIRNALEGGWRSAVLPNLKRVVETG